MNTNGPGSLLDEIFQELETPAPPSKARLFNCNAADHHSVEDVLKASVPIGTLQTAVETAINTVITWTYKAAGDLRVSPRSAGTISLFKSAFVKPPDWQPPWKPAKASWIDFGDLVAFRLLAAAKILNGGYINYFCFGSAAHCPECTDPANTYIACSSWGKTYRICLGADFWKDWQSGNVDSMALNLLHEALHIYFGTTVAHTGRSGNASCYQRFVSDSNGRPLLTRLKTRCPG